MITFMSMPALPLLLLLYYSTIHRLGGCAKASIIFAFQSYYYYFYYYYYYSYHY